MKTTSGFCPCWDWRGGQTGSHWAAIPPRKRCRKGQARLVLLAEDLSQHTAGGVRFAAEEAGVDVLTAACTMDEISMALGKRTGVVAVNDAGFAKKLHELCEAGTGEPKW